MKLHMYSIYDCKSGVYRMPYCSLRRDEAIRLFAVDCSIKETELHRFAEDFTLFHIAEYDTDTGLITPFVAPISVISATEASIHHKEYYASLSFSDEA